MTSSNLKTKHNNTVEMDAVEDLLETYGTLNPFLLCKKIGITVNRAKLRNNNGLLYTDNDKKIMLINEKCDMRKSNLICAHLLGVAVLHGEVIQNFAHVLKNVYMSGDQYSISGNRFAINLILHDKDPKLLNKLTKNYINIVYGVHVAYYYAEAF